MATNGEAGTTQPEFRHAEQRKLWGTGWRRYLFPGLWLIYLGQTVSGVQKHSSGAAAVIGYVIVAAFAAVYILSIPSGWTSRRRFWPMYGVGFALMIAETFFAHDDAFVMCVYLAVLTVAAMPRHFMPVVFVLALITFCTPWAITSWGGKPDVDGALAVILVSFAMYGFFAVMQSNIALGAARAEVARLAAENERSRIARDLHDLLGHSLTTVTVKSGLARRLAERGETARAVGEISEVESLARRTLGEVRAAVAGYRDVTLAGEIASAAGVLRAAGIEPVLPGAVDIVDEDASELFGWVVREAVTNVVRHSRAAHCTITLGSRWVEIVDDGIGGTGGAGNGLSGLRERLAARGGTIEIGGCPSGWRVRADLAPAPIDAETPTADALT
jgi:two-component system, NarL family, sensor histidine kinase DesK